MRKSAREIDTPVIHLHLNGIHVNDILCGLARDTVRAYPATSLDSYEHPDLCAYCVEFWLSDAPILPVTFNGLDI